MSTIYHPYRVNLTAGQAESVAKAMKHKHQELLGCLITIF